MIQIRDIKKSFGSLEVLKGIDLTIEKGEVVSIVGPSGAGKTTLLQIIGSLDRADSGSVTFGGQDITRLSQRKLADFRNRHIGFVFQFHQLLPEFSALENVMIPALIAGTPRRQAKERALHLLELMGLEDRRDHKPAELSGGEKQRVAVARALVNDPDVILADEPSGSLDTKNKTELHSLFFNLRDKLVEYVEKENWKDILASTPIKKILDALKDDDEDAEISYYRVRLEGAFRDALKNLAILAASNVKKRYLEELSSLWYLLDAVSFYFNRSKTNSGAYRFDDVALKLASMGMGGRDVETDYRLDVKTRHLLLDEFQDASYKQWEKVYVRRRYVAR